MISLVNTYAADGASRAPARSSLTGDLGQTAAALALAKDTAKLLGLEVEETWCSLCNLPLNMVGLLDSPHGWSVLSAYIADDLGLSAPVYWPQVH